MKTRRLPAGRSSREFSARSTSAKIFIWMAGRENLCACLLQLPIVGGPPPPPLKATAAGLWRLDTHAVAPELRALQRPLTIDGGDQNGLGPGFGWFSRRRSGYPETLSLKCQVHPAGGRKRPTHELEDYRSPLGDQAATGHNVRPAARTSFRRCTASTSVAHPPLTAEGARHALNPGVSGQFPNP